MREFEVHTERHHASLEGIKVNGASAFFIKKREDALIFSNLLLAQEFLFLIKIKDRI